MAMASVFPTSSLAWAPKKATGSKVLRFSRQTETAEQGEGEKQRLRRELKDSLSERLEETKGNLDEDALRLISSLEGLNPMKDLKEAADLYKGCFRGVRASFKNSGRKGEVQKEVGYSGAIVTLGRAAFNVFKPASTEIVLDETYNHVGLSSEDEYSLIIKFKLLNEDLEGLLINRAKYTISDMKRMDVVFISSTLRPRWPEKDLARWISVFKDANPGINEDCGDVLSNLPAAKGWLDFLYLDEELRITKGNRGGVSVVQRLDKPLFSI